MPPPKNDQLLMKCPPKPPRRRQLERQHSLRSTETTQESSTASVNPNLKSTKTLLTSMSRETMSPLSQLPIDSPPNPPRRRQLEIHQYSLRLPTRTSTESSIASVNGNSLRPVLGEDSVVALLTDLYDDMDSLSKSKSEECWKALFENYHSPKYVLIRPSGNPLTVEGIVQMFCNADLKPVSISLISVDSVQIIADGLAAVATYTVDQKFNYKGTTLNEDRCVLTCVLEELGGEIKIVHEQRTSGQSIPKESRWEAL
jgi:hypothetical protein